MKIIFFGTPAFAAHILSYLNDQKVDIVAIVTQPDKEKGRTSKKNVSVKDLAQKQLPHIPLFQPQKASDSAFLEKLKSFNADLFVVVAYGKILSTQLLDIPKLDTINVHASLLPKYRGAAPIQRALMNGDKKTGITIMKVVKELDAGDILAIQDLEISNSMDAGDLEKALCEIAKPLLLKVIKQFKDNKVSYTPQNNSQATYAHKIDKEDRWVHVFQDAHCFYNQVRGLSPYPGAFIKLCIQDQCKQLLIKKCHPINHQAQPGELFAYNGHPLCLGCEKGSIALDIVQPEGKKAMDIKAFMAGIKQDIKLVHPET